MFLCQISCVNLIYLGAPKAGLCAKHGPVFQQITPRTKRYWEFSGFDGSPFLTQNLTQIAENPCGAKSNNLRVLSCCLFVQFCSFGTFRAFSDRKSAKTRRLRPLWSATVFPVLGQNLGQESSIWIRRCKSSDYIEFRLLSPHIVSETFLMRNLNWFLQRIDRNQIYFLRRLLNRDRGLPARTSWSTCPSCIYNQVNVVVLRRFTADIGIKEIDNLALLFLSDWDNEGLQLLHRADRSRESPFWYAQKNKKWENIFCMIFNCYAPFAGERPPE